MYERYCKLRDAKGLNDAEVAKLCGLKKGMFSDWKAGRGTPKVDKIIILADFFEVSLDWLIRGKETKNNSFPFDAEHLDLIMLYSKLKKEQKENILNLLRSFS